MARSTTTSFPPGTLYSPCAVPFAVFIGTVYPNPGPGPSPGMTTGSVMDGTFSAYSAGERVNPRPRLPDRWPARTKRSPCASLLAVQGHCRSEEHTSELQSLMRLSYAVFCLKKKIKHHSI